MWARKVGAKEVDAFVEKLPQRYIVLRMILPAIGKSISSRDQLEVQARGVKLMLALEIFNRRNGHYPQTLDELVPGVLPEMPLDPCSGRAYGYRILTSAEDPDHRRYTLYSVGADGVDNHGTMLKDKEWMAMRAEQGRGLDYVVNPARQKLEVEEAPAPVPAESPADPAPEPTGGPG
jgi:hypothetical protein